MVDIDIGTIMDDITKEEAVIILEYFTDGKWMYLLLEDGWNYCEDCDREE